MVSTLAKEQRHLVFSIYEESKRIIYNKHYHQNRLEKPRKQISSIAIVSNKKVQTAPRKVAGRVSFVSFIFHVLLEGIEA